MQPFKIDSIKLYKPVVTLPINENVKLLESLKQGVKRAISCNKYRSEITAQPNLCNIWEY